MRPRPDDSKHQHTLALLADNQVRFVGPQETISAAETNRFQLWTTAEISSLLGRLVGIDKEGRPVLVDANEHKMIQSMALIRDQILANPKLSNKEKRRQIQKLRMGLIEQRRTQVQGDLDKTSAEYVSLKARRDALVEVGEWLQDPLTLGRPDGSQLDAMRQAGRDRKIVVLRTERDIDFDGVFESLQSFVVAHNWAGAISQAEIVGEGAGEVSLPFSATCFEFVVTGKRVMLLVIQDPDNVQGGRVAVVTRLSECWAVLMSYDLTDGWHARPIAGVTPEQSAPFQPLVDLLMRNAWAIGVMLDAKIVEREVVRVDERLNRAREKRGKLPLHSYHVVSLVRRDRVAPRPAEALDPDREINRKRWHLVRAHWRHFTDHRTRIPWHSRGDLDVGLIDKHYKL